LVVWGLIPLDLTDDHSDLAQAITSEKAAYGNDIPDGLIIVAGSEKWINTYTLDLILHGTKQATACDGSQSAYLACRDDVVIGPGMIGGFQYNPFALGSYRDAIQRYGFKGVPE
jgi:hypothetical protein